MIPELWRLKEENQKFKVIFGYTRLSLSKEKKREGRKQNNTVCILCCLLESTPPLKMARQSSRAHSEKVSDFPGPQLLPFHSLGGLVGLPASAPLMALKRVLSGAFGTAPRSQCPCHWHCLGGGKGNISLSPPANLRLAELAPGRGRRENRAIQSFPAAITDCKILASFCALWRAVTRSHAGSPTLAQVPEPGPSGHMLV